MHHPTDRIAHTTAIVTPVMEHWLEREIAQWVHPMKDRSDDPSHYEWALLQPEGKKIHDFSWVVVAVQVLMWCHQTCVRRTVASADNIAVISGRKRERERNVLFNDALNTFYLRLYGVRHMVKDHSNSEKGNLLPPHRLLLSINSKGSFICTIPQTG